MFSRADLANKPHMQLILILLLCLASVILFSLVGGGIAIAMYGIDSILMTETMDPDMVGAMKLVQLFSAIGLFIVPPIVYGLFLAKNPLRPLNLSKFGKWFNYLLILVLMAAFTPFLSWLIEINANMHLPDFMEGVEQWMKSSEAQAESLTKAFLTFDGFGSLVYVMVIVAVVPALGEEFLFRGVLQKTFIQWTKNAHISIWVTAILFSAMHLQFFGFFPRLLLGVIFGYLFFWSKSLWLPIAGHFINNASVVLLSYFAPDQLDNTDITLTGDEQSLLLFALSSLVVSVLLMLLIRKVNTKNSSTTVVQST